MAEDLVAAARSWIGTPYRHQASLKGVGADCLGLIRGIWRERYGHEPEAVPDYTRDWAEPEGEEQILSAAGRLMARIPLAEAVPGDVLVFRMRQGSVAKHLGLLSAVVPDRAAFIHAYERGGVVESPLAEPWRRRIAGVFRLPDCWER